MRRIRPAVSACLLAMSAAVAHADINWVSTYMDPSAGWTDPVVGATRRATAQAVFDYINTYLDHNGTVNVTFAQSDFNATGPLATAGTRYSGSPNGFQQGHTFINATTGVDPDPTRSDATVTVDFGYNWNNGLGAPGNGQVDLFSVILHEITHALGVSSQVNGSGVSNITNSDPGVYTVYNSFLRTGNTNGGTPLFGPGGDFLGAPSNLSGNTPGVFFYGPNVMAVNNGNPMRVFTQPTFNNSSISHYTSAGVMAPAIGTGPNNVRRTYSRLDIAMLKDLGWSIKPHPLLGPQNFKFFNDNSGIVGGFDINAGADERFYAIFFEFDDPTEYPQMYVEHANTAGSAFGHLTQLGHAATPGMIALLNDDGSGTPGGKTWVSVNENFRSPTAADEKLVFSADVNPNAGSEEHSGSYLDFVLGPEQGTADAQSTGGIGVRLHVSGSLAGKYQLFDGTNPAGPLLVDEDFFLTAAKPSSDDIFNLALEFIAPRFDDVSSTLVRFLLDGVLMHEFNTAGGLGNMFMTFYAGVSDTARPGDYAVYGVDNVSVELMAVPEPGTLVLLAVAGLAALRRRAA